MSCCIRWAIVHAVNDRDLTRRMFRECFAFRVRRASRVISRTYDQALQDVDLTATQLMVLSAIVNRPDLKMAELADELGLEASTFSRATALLVRRKLLRRTSSSSRRERFFAVTPAGRRKIRAAFSRWESAQAQVRHQIGADIFASLTRALSAL